MNFMNTDANIKQFQLLRFVNENCSDEHVVSKISIVLRRDKIEAPYYMMTGIKMSSCIDMPENGIVHAMDVLNHQRMHNLSKETYDEIESLVLDVIDRESDQIKVFKKEDRLKVILMSRSNGEFKSLFEGCYELFERIDALID